VSGDGALPSVQNNPSLLLIDTDSLLQLLIADQMRLLHFVKRRFRIQPAIVEAVEAEVRKSKKFRAQFTKELQKAIDNHAVEVIDSRTMPAFVNTDPHAVFNSIQTTGFDYGQRGLDYGEAYTFAAGVILNAPVISNDHNAVLTAQNRRIPLPTYIFRTYDLIVLCHQTEQLSTKECEDIRQALAKRNEYVPVAFQHTSFVKGLQNFYPRLLDGSKVSIASNVPITKLDVRLTIVPSGEQ
jgi:hypothetical protein